MTNNKYFSYKFLSLLIICSTNSFAKKDDIQPYIQNTNITFELNKTKVDSLYPPSKALLNDKESLLKTAYSSEYRHITTVKASNSDEYDHFGSAIAVSGDTMVVGAYAEGSNATEVNGYEGDSGDSYFGAAYVYVLKDGSWIQQAYLKASNAQRGDKFGKSVAISGDTIVIGATGEDSISPGVNADQNDNSARDVGAAYVFVREGASWKQQAYLKASNAHGELSYGGGDRFGSAVAIDGDIIVIGAPREDSNARWVNGNQDYNRTRDAGAAYVFSRSGKNWTQQAYLKSSRPGFEDYFGSAVDISGNIVVVGAYGEKSNATGINGNDLDNSLRNSGAVYAYVYTEGEWSFEAYIKSSNSNKYFGLGFTVSIFGNVLVTTGTGNVLVFKRESSGWKQAAIIANPSDDYGFGHLISIYGDSIIVGTYIGSYYLFNRINHDTWELDVVIKDPNYLYQNFDIPQVAIDGQTIVFGSHNESAYVFQTDIVEMKSSHTALWYNPNENGHGLSIYLLKDRRIVVTWYVYDHSGRPLWLLGVGEHNGYTAKLDVKRARGGLFPPNFNSEEVEYEDWGRFELDFFGCNDGLFKWSPKDYIKYPPGESNIVRLNQTLDLPCIEESKNHVEQYKKTSETSMFSGYTGLWYNPEQNGHGINVYMLDNNKILVIWYIFDHSGNPLWLIGTGQFDGTVANLDVSITKGGKFPPNFNENNVILNNWGKFELNFSDCNNVLFKWSPTILYGNSSGELELKRLTTTHGLVCENPAE